MFDMLFVNGSHPLSPYIYSLNSKFGHLPDKERNEVKEKLDPSARLVKLNQEDYFAHLYVFLFCTQYSFCLWLWWTGGDGVVYKNMTNFYIC